MADRAETSARLGWGYRATVLVVIPLLRLLLRRDWRGGENLPRTGGVVAVTVHASNLDPMTFAHFVHGNGRVMRFLAKSSLFSVPGLGPLLRSAQQIPVHRGTDDAARAYDSAVAAVRAGQLVAVFPEGTLTRDPDLWPMRGKTGAARIALATGAPVVPIGQWGAHTVLPRYTTRLRLFPRKTVHVWAGPPVDLDDLRDRPVDAETLREATDRIMAALVGIVAEQRGETPPETLFDPKAAGLPETGRYDGHDCGPTTGPAGGAAGGPSDDRAGGAARA
ncbi:lysophospholipid acyltransferase family protein [Aquipuribacter hungaricus]|uniref:Lysophospholipid acyltransferase family protein n=1 Tax=Aquipuribacter hungaricus TaxID=545624 RepID=A0ABV7WEX2_9MICO